MIKVDFEKCTACGACVQICPVKCICWQEGEFGFRYPCVDQSKCINCHQCEKVCPLEKELVVPENQHYFAAVHRNRDILSKSTSGGVFTALADYVLERNGIVYGCTMDDAFQVKHVRISSKEELAQLRSSKYVQSNTMNTFRQALIDLRKGLYVLYTGTPCQIAGLNHFLGKSYERLITIDIVCHGVGSQKYFDKFLTDLKQREKDIVGLRFRDKKYVGWSCGGVVVVVNNNNTTLKGKNKEKPFYNFENYYYSYFLSGTIYRKSCYSCPYASLKRPGDFTLGDFWGVESLKLELDVSHGCSLVITNTEKAHKIFKELTTLSEKEVTFEQSVKHNAQLNHPVLLNSNVRNKLLEQYETMTGTEIQKYYKQDNKMNLIKGEIKIHMPYGLKMFIRSLR